MSLSSLENSPSLPFGNCLGQPTCKVIFYWLDGATGNAAHTCKVIFYWLDGATGNAAHTCKVIFYWLDGATGNAAHTCKVIFYWLDGEAVSEEDNSGDEEDLEALHRESGLDDGGGGKGKKRKKASKDRQSDRYSV